MGDKVKPKTHEDGLGKFYSMANRIDTPVCSQEQQYFAAKDRMAARQEMQQQGKYPEDYQQQTKDYRTIEQVQKMQGKGGATKSSSGGKC